MSVENVDKWASHVTLVNGYGPTEASVIAIANPHVSTQKDASNIGRPLSSGHAWIVDPQDHNQLAPVGSVGELLLEGPLLAREYINNVSKTEEVFIERPPWASIFYKPKGIIGRPPLSRFQSSQSGNFSPWERDTLQRPPLSRFQSNQSGRFSLNDRDIHCRPQLSRSQSDQSQLSRSSYSSKVRQNKKMYKTGDLVKYSHDGSIIFIGRKDHQYGNPSLSTCKGRLLIRWRSRVKLNGQRMEPGEIEHALDKDPQVQHALVVLPKSGPFRSRLISVLTLAE
jgi:non-ribosomal peptide synthetase component F